MAATPEAAGLDAGAEAPRRSILATWAEVVADAGGLLRAEASLARLETADNLKFAGRSVLRIGAGLLLMALAVVFLAVAAVVALAALVGLGWALLLVALGQAALGGLLLWQGQAGFAGLSLLPERAIARLSDDLARLGERTDRASRTARAPEGGRDEAA